MAPRATLTNPLPSPSRPLSIYYIRRVVKLWYTRQEGFEGASDVAPPLGTEPHHADPPARPVACARVPSPPLAEKHLRELRAKQRTTIEDIKTKSNYYSTKNLLEKYDETPKVRGSLRSSPWRERRVLSRC